MDTATILSIIGTIAATLGGKEAWAYYKKKLDVKARLKKAEAMGEDKLQAKVEGLLEQQISDLKEQVRLLTERIKHMEEERESDKKRIANQEIKIALLSERLTSKFKSTGRNKGGDEDIPTID
jgi:predicted  nucleic acid-binding Zn-ribbon protein